MQSLLIDNCRLCKSSHLQPVRDFGSHYLSGRFPAADEPDPPSAPIRLMFCADCGLLQLAHNYAQDELFRHTYGYRSGINQMMRSHLAGITKEAVARVGLKSGDVVLDIGSNDATLLTSYPISGLTRFGMDPTIAQYRSYYPEDITTAEDYFSAAKFAEISSGRKARAITSIAMFYDLPDPGAFVADIAASLAQDGMWIFEQCHVGLVLERNAFDTICHEHLEYYGVAQVHRLLSMHGMRISDVELNDINGGSFRVYACHQNAPYQTSSNIDGILAMEKQAGLDKVETYIDFCSKMDRMTAELSAFLHAEKSKGKSIYIYGASTKGNTLLQLCGLGKNVITAAADRNPLKWGRRTPATGIPIISEEEARAASPHYFLVLPWHFRDEFVEREKSFRETGGKLIFPLPHLEVI
jgi:NDP-4-keto-2,6-dideoxyhexose 3-C-methyltransferase